MPKKFTMYLYNKDTSLLIPTIVDCTEVRRVKKNDKNNKENVRVVFSYHNPFINKTSEGSMDGFIWDVIK